MPSPRGEPFFAGTVRVTRGDGTPILLDSVTVRADSVVGREHAPPHARIAIPAAEVQTVEARTTDPITTAVLVFVPMLAAVALWSAYRLGRDGFND